jgi:hypothetical protein
MFSSLVKQLCWLPPIPLLQEAESLARRSAVILNQGSELPFIPPPSPTIKSARGARALLVTRTWGRFQRPPQAARGRPHARALPCPGPAPLAVGQSRAGGPRRLPAQRAGGGERGRPAQPRSAAGTPELRVPPNRPPAHAPWAGHRAPDLAGPLSPCAGARRSHPCLLGRRGREVWAPLTFPAHNGRGAGKRRVRVRAAAKCRAQAAFHLPPSRSPFCPGG